MGQPTSLATSVENPEKVIAGWMASGIAPAPAAAPSSPTPEAPDR